MESLEPRVIMSGGGALTAIAARVGIPTALAARINGHSTLPAATLAHTVSKLSRAADIFAATSVAGKAFFAGGEMSPSGDVPVGTKVVDIYDAASRTWTTAMMSTARVGDAAVTVGNKALFAGGEYTGVVDVYDATTGNWSVTTPPVHIRGSISTVVGDKAIFAIHPGNGADIGEIYDATTGVWSTSPLPVPLELIPIGVGLNLGSEAILSNFQSTIDTYDLATGQWSSLPVPKSFPIAGTGYRFSGAVAVGRRAIFSSGDGKQLHIYDSVTDKWSTVPVPASLVPFDLTSTLGSKALMASNNSVAVYDTQTGRWSTTTPNSTSRDYVTAVAVGTQALFAGGNDIATLLDVNTVDIYTDLTPTPILSGSFTGHAGGNVTVTVNNTGDADLPADATVAVYASKDRTLRHAIELGRITLAQPLAAGDSATVTVSTTIPTTLHAGNYHLLSAAGTGLTLTPLAAQAATFRGATVAIARPSSARGDSVSPGAKVSSRGAWRRFHPVVI